MRDLLIIVPRQPLTTGNHVTARRFSLSLQQLGWQVRLVEVLEAEVEPINLALQQRPDVVLLLHAYRSGRPWLLRQAAKDIPCAVLMTGTDMNLDLKLSGRAEVINRVLSSAAAIIVQNRFAYDELQLSNSRWTDKLQMLPPGIVLGRDQYPLRSELKLDAAELLMLHPAGIRPVKGNLELLQMTAEILQRYRRFHLVFCGPILDRTYGERLLAELGRHERATYIGEIPCAAMPDVLRQADLVLNNSSSEGVSNALVEAASLGRPVLARDIPGNRCLVQNGVNGMLFADQDEFAAQLLRFLDDPTLRSKLSRPDAQGFSAEREGERLAAILEPLALSS